MQFHLGIKQCLINLINIDYIPYGEAIHEIYVDFTVQKGSKEYFRFFHAFKTGGILFFDRMDIIKGIN